LAAAEGVLDKKFADSAAKSSAGLTAASSAKDRDGQAAVREVKP